MALLAAVIIAIPIFATTASRVQPRWTLINTASALCLKSDNLYYGSVTAGTDVTRLDIDIVLYEKGFLTGYKEVSSIHKTVYRAYHTATNTYTYSSSKDYKVELTVTAYTQSGQTETITVSNEYT